MPSIQALLKSCVVASLVLLVESRPTSNNLQPSRTQSWQDWSAPDHGPTNSTTPANSTSNDTIPAYTNTPVTFADLFEVEDFSDFDFNSTSPEPYNPNEPDPEGTFDDRLTRDEEDVPAVVTFSNTTSSPDALMSNVQAILRNVELDPSNSVLARVLLQSLKQTQSLPTNANDTDVVTLKELSLFLESCFLDYDSCLFWDADTMEIVDAAIAIAATGLWEAKSVNQSVWPTIAQWMINMGVDILVGDRPITNNMVVPVTLMPGGATSAVSPVLIPSTTNF